MRSRWIAPRHDVYTLILIGAFMFGLGGLRSLDAQQPRAIAKGPSLADDRVGGQHTTPDLTVRLRAQQLATRKAKVTYEIANLTRELTEIAEQEYLEFIFPQDLASIESEIRRTELDLGRAKDLFERGKRLRESENKFFPRAQSVSEELLFKKAQFALEQAQSKRDVLVKYTKPKTIREFKSELEKVRSNEVAGRQAWEREEAKEAELVRQLNLT